MQETRNQRAKNLMLFSILVALVVLAIKYVAYRITGSVALYSDALESVVNVAAAVVALLAVRWAAMPPDHNHLYGHHKAEYLSAVMEGVAIVIAALLIIHEAWLKFQAPSIPVDLAEGIAVNIAASLINGLWCGILIHQGRRLRSPAISADGRHLLSDVVSSVGVAAGVGIAAWTEYWILDPILACLVAVNILWSGWGLITRSVDGLMDAAPDPKETGRLVDTILTSAGGAIEVHDLRARHAGPATFMEFHLVVPGTLSVEAAHQMCDRIERAIEQDFPNATITIHVEPEHKAKQDAGAATDDGGSGSPIHFADPPDP